MKPMLLALPLLLLACAASDPSASEPETSMPSASAAPTAATASSSEEQQLAGDWRIIAIEGAAIRADLAGQLAQPLTVSFDIAQGRVSGYSGCNRFSGSYRSADRPFALDRLASSKMYCESTAELESQILQALRRVSRFQLDGERLKLLDASGTTLLKLARGT
jgi:heat shock protein HslJ